MKISFSTLGCPGWSWEEIVAAALDLGYDGIELRGIGKEIYVPKAKPFGINRLAGTKESLRVKGLEIPCITSSCCLNQEPDRAAIMAEGRDYVDLASSLSSPYVRVLGDKDPQPSEGVDLKQVVSGLRELCEYAAPRGVTLLLETNGVLSDPDTMLQVIEETNHPNAAVLWDIHHPYRYMGASPWDVCSKIGKYIRHVHVKDSRIEDARIRYCLLGQGDIPVRASIDALKNLGYQGWISLEWVKRWYDSLEEPGIVFSHSIYTLKGLL